MISCRIEDRHVVQEDSLGVIRLEWKRLVNARKIGTTVINSIRYVIAVFETKSGSPADAINTPAGPWLLTESEAQGFGV